MQKAATLLALLCIAAFAQQKGTFTDTRDGKTYKTTKIGEQVWMAENLNYEASGSKCYGEGGIVFGEDYDEITLSSSEIQANCKKYGRLYNWATAMDIDKRFNKKEWNGSDVKHQGVCPNGWHLPSNAEWGKLYRYADGDKGTKSFYKSETAGKYLKSISGWNESGNGTDKFGFSALPGGVGDPNGSFDDVGYEVFWWSASEYDSDGAYSRYMSYDIELAYWAFSVKSGLYSVRCVGD
ncbi:MAG: fibrobacter succinogenes major paralogous domain-containing protein [Fibromonadaceae bacterium]|jgi:uncharacterized protein (TIGR02145 family)|nr:fibrobacter succinogenes major paralogous domain-containing protein [Fibromonadaceae bacterium]